MEAPFSNPFGAPSTNNSQQSSPFVSPGVTNNPFAKSPLSNPFGAPSSAQPSAFGSPAPSPFPSPAPSNPFAAPITQARSASSSFASPATNGSSRAPPTAPANLAAGLSASGRPNANSMARIGKSKGLKIGFGGPARQNADASQTGPFNSAGRKPAAEQQSQKRTIEARKFQAGQKKNNPRQERPQARITKRTGGRNTPTREPSERTKELSPFAYNYAISLWERLRRDNIEAPEWKFNLGDPNNRGEVEGLKDKYKKYRARVYDSLRKAEIIDDPEKKRRLADALPFKGICEDMCPEFEQVSRIAEHDVKTEEKSQAPGGTALWADPAKMVKKFGRSAAGQDAPLPQDVRSVDALRRTTDYLFNDLLQSDNNLPSMHNFLWDRTRAVRRDFTFHSQKSPEEMKDMVYCFETITRFHATALHLLSRKGYAQEDFDFKQEIEQLGRTILSLVEAYDACREKDVHCENEPEFRAYYLLLNVHDPSIAKRIPTWGKDYWLDSEEIQTAMSLIQAMEDVREMKGPIKPRRGTTLSDEAFTNYFAIVEDPKVSYTMACIAEIHFTTVRQNILRNLVRGYARYRDAPRTISAADLNKLLRFDTPEEAVEFAKAHNFEFSSEYPQGKAAPPAPYLVLNDKKKTVPSPRVTQSFSGQLVERKRGSQSLPFIIHNTIYEDPTEKPKELDSPDGLFVSQSPSASETSSNIVSTTLSAQSQPSSSFGFPSASSGRPSPFGGLSQPLSGIAPSPFQTTPRTFQGPFQPADKTDIDTAKESFSIFLKPPSVPALHQGSKPNPMYNLPDPPSTATKPADAPNPFATQMKEPNPAQGSAVDQGGQLPSSISIISTTTAPSMSDKSTVAPQAGRLDSGGPAPPSALRLGLKPLPAPSNLTSMSPAGLSGQSSLPATSASKFFTPPAQPPATPAQSLAIPGSIMSASSTVAPSPSVVQASPIGTPPVPKPTSAALPASSSASPQPQSSFFSTQTTSSAAATPAPPKRDLMGDFTKWFVLGDEGLMDQFTEFTIQEIVTRVYEQFREEEAEKIRKAEDEQSWKRAREYRTYSLGTKYLHRWQENARSRATKRILAQGKEKMRLYREQERIKRREAREEAAKAERLARKEAQRRIEADGQQLSLLASTSKKRRSGTEEQLLASGIFSGLRDERAAARQVMQDSGNGGWGRSSALGSYAESELVLEPRRQSISTRDGQRQTPDSTASKREGWKTRSLREKFGLEHRRSVSAGSSIYSTSKLRQSLPAPRKTNFSRKRSADETSDEERDPKRKSVQTPNGFKTKHWDLRARGLVPMPDGQWLPESMAKSMRESMRLKDLPNDRLERAAFSPSEYEADSIADNDSESNLPASLRLRLAKLQQRSTFTENQQQRHSLMLPPSRSESYISPPAAGERRNGSPAKRKRGDENDEEEDEEAQKRAQVSRFESQVMIENVQKMVHELKEAMDVLDEDRVFWREQSGILGDREET
ncbi:SAC3/GANP/Nin1/mts3/eIF-3 p25 family-domain-containing protein [Echria macrotheca]|uniref:SAC3/GANP/Nin1/mts3/eIF-3 p25 family-domain-containing protein n=1 Tax=Echria macrotheca TaxID=438768 RepID=A0AAJ0FES2_9PEZI|nr:SAC3/GANP/Nin1/mts3/eIF-3 p25 family-domain-containing protein [Echria macrotheca]